MANDLRTATVLKIAGIDFYSAGHETLEKVCSDKNIDISAIETNLAEVQAVKTEISRNFTELNADNLCDYIVNTDHKEIKKLLAKLSFNTETLADIYGSHRPELLKISMQFTKINNKMRLHLAREEEILFPAIREFLCSNSPDSKSIIVAEICRMKTEHENVRSGLENIKKLSNNYHIPPHASIIFMFTYKLLEQFMDDLILHIHLENNILFPKALELVK